VNYFHDKTKQLYQYEVYNLAAHIALKTESKRILDVGCGSGEKLAILAGEGFDTLGIDFGANIMRCKETYPNLMWKEWDLSKPHQIQLSSEDISDAVVISADVIEHLLQPEYLVDNLLVLLKKGATAVVLSTVDRDVHSGVNKYGPPNNPTHIREWTLWELTSFLSERGLPIKYAGHTESYLGGKERGTTTIVASYQDIIVDWREVKNHYENWKPS
jgi:cyclopropane fatty-acyl-phospholipid synthase-like methyltransferase